MPRIKYRGPLAEWYVPKRCRRCNKIKNPGHFYIRTGGYALSSYCRPCSQEYARQSRLNK